MKHHEPHRLRELQANATIAGDSKTADGVAPTPDEVVTPPTPLARPTPPVRRATAKAASHPTPASSPGDAVRAGWVVALGLAAGAVLARILGRGDDTARA